MKLKFFGGHILGQIVKMLNNTIAQESVGDISYLCSHGRHIPCGLNTLSKLCQIVEIGKREISRLCN